MSGLRILISGGGIAGPAVAYFLAKGGASVTVIERASRPRPSGQNIDIRGSAIQVIQAMNLEEDIRARHTTEDGIAFVDKNNKVVANFAADKTGATETFTAEFEITRSQLAKLFYEKTRDTVDFVFGDYVTKLEEKGDKVEVTLAKRGVKEYDIVIGADGLGSKTRSMVFPDFKREWFKQTGVWMSFFTIPKTSTDSKTARWYTATGKKALALRPDDEGNARALLSFVSSAPELDEVVKKSHADQKALLRKLYEGAGWETDRILAGMDSSEDFYMVNFSLSPFMVNI
jgi:2-polyprenyl-6-methoxyphenol hydroxylase-like FAD-dependent oxidoreductase